VTESIKTERLELIPYTAEQLQRTLERGSEAAAASYGLTHPPMSWREWRLRRKIYRSKLQIIEESPKAHLLATAWQITGNGVIVGEVGFKGPPKLGEIEIGYTTHPGYRRQGYMSEAVAALCAFAFGQTTYNVTRIAALTRRRNFASQKVLTKCGFVRDGTQGWWLLRWVLDKTAAEPQHTKHLQQV
jgi:RimJ/RimL family protein N-acetyltransferase